MHDILEAINERCGWDCWLVSYDGWRLLLSSGTSAESASPLAEFSGVSYVSCPTEFSHPRFRPANDEERSQVEELVPIETTDHIVAIEAETMSGLGTHVFFVVAEVAALAPTEA